MFVSQPITERDPMRTRRCKKTTWLTPPELLGVLKSCETQKSEIKVWTALAFLLFFWCRKYHRCPCIPATTRFCDILCWIDVNLFSVFWSVRWGGVQNKSNVNSKIPKLKAEQCWLFSRLDAKASPCSFGFCDIFTGGLDLHILATPENRGF